MPFSTFARVRLAGACVVAAVLITGGAAAAWTGPVASSADAPAQARGSSSTTTSPTDAERRGRDALHSLDYPWRDLGYTVEFRTYEGGTLGTANSRTRTITIYVKPSHSRQALRSTIAHELAHALDFEHATAERRREYRSVRRLSQSARWYPCDGCSDYDSHAGDWAEVFAVWLAGPGDFRSNVAPAPDKEQLRRLGPLFRVPEPAAASARPAPHTTASPRPTTTPSPSSEPSSSSALLRTLRP